MVYGEHDNSCGSFYYMSPSDAIPERFAEAELIVH